MPCDTTCKCTHTEKERDRQTDRQTSEMTRTQSSLHYAAFRLRARSDRVDRSDAIATIDTIAAETLPYPSRDRSDRSDRIATIAGA